MIIKVCLSNTVGMTLIKTYDELLESRVIACLFFLKDLLMIKKEY